MALTMKMLKGFNLDENVQQAILDAHLETVNGLTADRDKYKADADKLAEVQKQLKEATKKLEEADHDGYKAKYEAEKAAHEQLKTDTANEKARNAKESALREALKTAGYSEAGIKKIVKYGGFIDSAEVDESGKLKDSDKLLESVASEWSEYKGTTKIESATPEHPPVAPSDKKVSPEAAEAQKIFAELHASQYGETKSAKE
ncbi:MAG: hypothetical protein J6P20_05305 [Oscillospiraceae bacterium]|nr:hypothetical protein [Oscillospiraceae bacterium]